MMIMIMMIIMMMMMINIIIKKFTHGTTRFVKYTMILLVPS
jgi:hypothetical protein